MIESEFTKLYYDIDANAVPYLLLIVSRRLGILECVSECHTTPATEFMGVDRQYVSWSGFPVNNFYVYAFDVPRNLKRLGTYSTVGTICRSIHSHNYPLDNLLVSCRC